MKQKFKVGQVWTTPDPSALARIIHIRKTGEYPIVCNVEYPNGTGFEYVETLTMDGYQVAGNPASWLFLVALHNPKHKDLVSQIVQTFGQEPQFAMCGLTVICAIRVGDCMRVSTAICGEQDTFKRKRGEKLAMQRMLAGQSVPVSSFAEGSELAECLRGLKW